MTRMCRTCSRPLMVRFRVLVRKWDEDRERYYGHATALSDKIVCLACAEKIVETLETLVPA